MKPTVTYPRADSVIVDHLDGELSGCTVGVKLPPDWTRQSTPHLQVAIDGTPVTNHPVSISPTVRLVAWSASPTVSHDLVMAAHGLVLAYVGPEFAARPLTGPLPASDPSHADAELCSATIEVTVRSIPLVQST